MAHDKELETIKNKLQVLALTEVNSRKLYDDLRFRYTVEIIEEYVILTEAVFDYQEALKDLVSVYTHCGPDSEEGDAADIADQASFEALRSTRDKFRAKFRARRILLPPELAAVVESTLPTVDRCLCRGDDAHDDLTESAGIMVSKMREMLGIATL